MFELIAFGLPKYCFSVAGFVGIMSFFQASEDPVKALKEFSDLFSARDAVKIVKMIHPDILADGEIRPVDIENFLKRYHRDSTILKNFTIDKRFKDAEGTTERFQATLLFNGPVLALEYPQPSALRMTLLWVLDKGRWWLERPLSIEYIVQSNASYPTVLQQETAMRFETALAVLDKMWPTEQENLLSGNEPSPLEAMDDYRELEKRYSGERREKGVDPMGLGVEVLLRIPSRNRGGMTELYRGDFPTGPEDKRPPVPWEMFRDYVNAAIEKGRLLEKQKENKAAENIYRRVMSIGKQINKEPGGFHFVKWGTTFEKQGAQELARILPPGGSGEKQHVESIVNLASRRLDLLQTALSCLDEMEEYNSLKAATIAAQRGNRVFWPWGINTLSIFALKGAPAGPVVMKSAGAIVLVQNPIMQKTASDFLEKVAQESSLKEKAFIEFQKEWIGKNRVFGTSPSFR